MRCGGPRRAARRVQSTRKKCAVDSRTVTVAGRPAVSTSNGMVGVYGANGGGDGDEEEEEEEEGSLFSAFAAHDAAIALASPSTAGFRAVGIGKPSF